MRVGIGVQDPLRQVDHLDTAAGEQPDHGLGGQHVVRRLWPSSVRSRSTTAQARCGLRSPHNARLRSSAA